MPGTDKSIQNDIVEMTPTVIKNTRQNAGFVRATNESHSDSADTQASTEYISQQKKEVNGKFSGTEGVDKQRQLEVIQSTNAMRDDIHTGIRSVEDIRTFEEALADDGIGEGDAGMAPDVSAEMIAKAKESGDIQRNLRRRQSGNECLFQRREHIQGHGEPDSGGIHK